MAIGDFYTQVIVIAIAVTVVLGYLWKRCNDAIDKLDNSTSQDGYLITSYIWSTDIKGTVERLFSFIKSCVDESESEDKFVELFTEEDKSQRLQLDLKDVKESYDEYLNVVNLFPDLVTEHEEQQTWILRTIFSSFCIAIWGAFGLLLDNFEGLLTEHIDIFWFILAMLLIIESVFVICIMKHSRKCKKIEKTIRKQKTKYRNIVKKVT